MTIRTEVSPAGVISVFKFYKMTEREQKLADNYKKCKDRAESVMYCIVNNILIEDPFSLIAGGFDKTEFSSEVQKRWDKLIDHIADHFIDAEEMNKEDGSFW